MITADAGNLSVLKNTMKKFNSLIRGGILSAALTLATFAAGPLTPPGAPGDAPAQMPSLVEIKAAIDALAAGGGLNGRTAIPAQAATFTISAAGSYVLTGNVTVATGNGININASNVSLDLNGFTISSTAVGAAMGKAITVLRAANNVRVHNGAIAGVDAAGQGWTGGIQFDWDAGAHGENLVFEDINIADVRGRAVSNTTDIYLGNAARAVVARRLCVTGGGALGIVFGPATGAGADAYGKVLDCAVRVYNSDPGIVARAVGESQSTGTGGGGGIVSTVGFDNY